MSYIDRDEIIEEVKLRNLLREVIKKCLNNQQNKENEEKKLRFIIRSLIKETKQEVEFEESKLRHVIRHYIMEGANKTDNNTDPVPYRSTALNYLGETIEGIFNQIREKMRQLTTPDTGGAQRESFRLHVLKDLSNFIQSKKAIAAGLPAMTSAEAADAPLEEAEEEETLTVNMPTEPGKVIPASERVPTKQNIPKKSEEEEEDEEFEKFQISGEERLGAVAAFRTLKNSNIYKTISDTRRELGSDPNEETKFDDYLLYNLDLLMVQEEETLAAEIGEEPAFTDTVTEPPEDAEMVQGKPEEEELL